MKETFKLSYYDFTKNIFLPLLFISIFLLGILFDWRVAQFTGKEFNIFYSILKAIIASTLLILLIIFLFYIMQKFNKKIDKLKSTFFTSKLRCYGLIIILLLLFIAQAYYLYYYSIPSIFG